jgi:acetyltransferase-like isoleucine patch superfamily enzyme
MVCEFMLVAIRHVPTRIGIGLRFMLVRRMAKRCGDCVAVFEGVYLYGLSHAEFGDKVTLMPMCYVDAAGGLRIGHDVAIAHGSSILTSGHDYSSKSRSTIDTTCHLKATSIGDDVWVGCGVRILAGVAVGSHTVIGAGAVVTKDIPQRSLAVGVPAKVIGEVSRESWSCNSASFLTSDSTGARTVNS